MSKPFDMFQKSKAVKLGRMLFILPARYWVIVLVMLILAGNFFLNFKPVAPHLDAIADEIGNLSYMVKNEGIWKNGKLQLNHAGDKMLFCESSEKGVGVFVADVASGQKKMVFEEIEICFGQGPHGVLKAYPWSPDDQRFVYGHQGKGASNGDFDQANETVLTVYNITTGQPEATFDIPFGQVATLDWLTSDAFVCASGANGLDFYFFERVNGQWEQSLISQKSENLVGSTTDAITGFATTSSNSIAWLQGNRLLTMNVTTKSVQTVVELPADPAIKTAYTSFDYSKEKRQFLISCIDNKADTLWQLSLDDVKSLKKIASLKRTHTKNWNDAVWINGTKSFAYIVPWRDTMGLAVQDVGAKNPVTHFQLETVQYFTASPDGRHLFVVGEVNDSLGADIWDYEIASKSLRCMVPAAEKKWQYSTYIRPQTTTVQLFEEKPANVVIYPPAGYDRRNSKKYPVLVTSISFAAAQPYLSQYAEAIANAGAYVVIVDRPWNFRTEAGFTNWEGYINDITRYLFNSKTLAFDKRRIFVMSNSAQSRALMKVLTNHPNIYRGAICLVPAGGLNNPAQLQAGWKPLKMLISTQTGAGGGLPEFQKEAWKSGMDVQYIIHPGTPHEFIAKQSQRERIQAMLHFIFDN